MTPTRPLLAERVGDLEHAPGLQRDLHGGLALVDQHGEATLDRPGGRP